MAAFLGSPWKMATVGATALAVVAFFAVLPSLFGAGIGTLAKIAFYQAWTIGLLLLVTTRVRSISIGTVVRYWLAGMFTVGVITSFVSGPLADLVEPGNVWVTPALEELLKALPLAVAVFMGRRAWRHPGLSDLLILGAAVGGGFAFHEEALWERGAVSGFDFNIGLFVPSVFRPEGLLVAGNLVWTAIIGFAIGLIILHRRHAAGIVAAVIAIVAVVADRMAANDVDGTVDVLRQLLFNGKLVPLIFLACVVASVLVDQQRLAATSVRDHLFPSPHSHAAIDDPDADIDPLKSVVVARYRRLRNGMHTTVAATTQHWPPRCEDHPAPLAELARLGRAADIAIGPGTSASGWAPDPESPSGFRFVGPNGFTVYAAGDQLVTPDATAEDGDEQTPRRPTATSISVPKARNEAEGTPLQARSNDYWQYVGLGVVGVALFAVVRLLTASDASDTSLATPFSLADAVNGPSLIIGIIGALAAAVAIRGRNNAVLGDGWEVGPGPDPSPNRTDECQA